MVKDDDGEHECLSGAVTGLDPNVPERRFPRSRCAASNNGLRRSNLPWMKLDAEEPERKERDIEVAALKIGAERRVVR
jgi:hypothetical protein